MASAWGKSWSASWGKSWGSIADAKQVYGGGSSRPRGRADDESLYREKWEYLDGLRELHVQIEDDVRGTQVVAIPLSMPVPAEVSAMVGIDTTGAEKLVVADIMGNQMALAMLAIMLSEDD